MCSFRADILCETEKREFEKAIGKAERIKLIF